MRTCVRMNPTPFRPARELEAAIERHELDFALALARELSAQAGRPLDLGIALRLLALAAAEQTGVYDAWALRWLVRWIGESREPTIEQAAEVAGALADLPAEPSQGLAALQRTCALR